MTPEKFKDLPDHDELMKMEHELHKRLWRTTGGPDGITIILQQTLLQAYELGRLRGPAPADSID